MTITDQTPSGRKRKASAMDVARVAQVSRSAVSRTFTPGASVAPETRARILAAAQALGYRQTQREEAHAAGARRRVAVILANLFSPYFCHLYAMFEDELRQRDFEVTWRVVSDRALLDGTVSEMIDKRVDGIIVLSAVPGATVRKRVMAANIPLVILDRQDMVEGAALVWIDGVEIGRNVAQLMLKEGRTRPAAIASNPRRLTELQAFADAMSRAGCPPCQWVDTGWTYENGISTARTLLAGKNRPDGIFAASDYLAVGIVDVARLEFGIRVPEELSVVGFGDTSQSRWLSHSISTVNLPLLSLVQTSVSTVADRLRSSVAPPPRIWLACDVVERGSTLGLSFAGGPIPGLLHLD